MRLVRSQLNSDELTVVDEYTRECLAVEVERRFNHRDVLRVLSRLFVRHGPPEHIRGDNGSEFTALAVRQWLKKLEVKGDDPLGVVLLREHAADHDQVGLLQVFAPQLLDVAVDQTDRPLLEQVQCGMMRRVILE